MAMENGPFLGDFPMKPPYIGDFPLPCHDVPSGNEEQFTNLRIAQRKFVNFLIKNGGSFHSCIRLPEGTIIAWGHDFGTYFLSGFFGWM